MRNISQYPITHDEAFFAVEEAREALIQSTTPGTIGDIRPYALDLVLHFLDKNKERFDEYSRERAGSGYW